LIDGTRVRIGDEINGKAVTIGESIDMMKGECGVSRDAAQNPSGVLLDDMKAKPPFGLPAIVSDEGLARQSEVDRVHHQRKLTEDQVLLAHAEAVHIGWALDRDLGNLLLRTIVADPDEAVDASEP
jgi:hypothetical protein